MLKYYQFRSTVKYLITPHTPKFILEIKKINFGDKKIKKSDFDKTKKVAKIDDIDVNKISL